MTSSLELPTAFIGELHEAQLEYNGLHARYNVAVEDVARMASDKGEQFKDSTFDTVLYALETPDNIGDPYEHAHRLQVTFAPAARKAKAADVPPQALTATVYDISSSSMPSLRKAAPHGAYVCGITLRRSIPLDDLGPKASSFYKTSQTQLAHNLNGTDRRYAVDPQGGTAEEMQRLPGFSALAVRAYGNTILRTALSHVEPDVIEAYDQAKNEDITNPRRKADDLPEYRRQSREVPDALSRIRELVAAIETSHGALDGELMNQLMVEDIGSIASLALLNTGLYNHTYRTNVSFSQRLQWIVGSAGKVQDTIRTHIGTKSAIFKSLLDQELVPAGNIVTRAEAIAADVQQPKGLQPDGTHWKVIRAL